MAYCPPELLDDLADLFAELRTWVGVREKKPGVFYAYRRPFLHFHLLAGGQRRADVKGLTSWGQLDLPRPVSTGRRRALVRELRLRYAEKKKRPSVERGGSGPVLSSSGARAPRRADLPGNTVTHARA